MRQRKRLAAFSVLALAASALAVFTSAPGAGAAPTTATSLVHCTNTFSPALVFNLPIDITTTVTDLADQPITSIQEGEQFKVTAQATIPLSEGFIAGVLEQVPTLNELQIPRVHIAIPPPTGAAGNDLTFDYAPGTVTIATGTPPVEEGDPPLTPIPGGVPLPSPSQTETYTASVGATSADFVLDPAVAGTPAAQAAGGTVWGAGGVRAAIEMDLSIFSGSVKVGFDCTDGGLTQGPGPNGIPGDADDVFALPVIPNAAFLSFPITPPPATVVIDDISGQAVNNAARAGNVIDFSGPNWDASSDITVEMCDLALTTCSAADLTGVTASIDVDGNLDGQATVAAGATTGARALQVSTDADQSDDIQILVLGAPMITVEPNEAGVGAPVDIHGTNWNPNSPGTVVSLTDGIGQPLDFPAGVTVNSAGVFDTELTVLEGTALVAAAETGLGYPLPPGPQTPGSLFAFAGFTVSENDCTVLGPAGCTIEQTVLFTTNAGTLSMSQESGIINLGELDLDGRAHHIPGAINEITTIDATGSLAGWDLTATMTDLVTDGGGGNKTIAASNMHWAPTCDPIDADGDGIVDGLGTDVASGNGATLDPTIGRTLCTAAPGGGGGTFTSNAALDLFVRANVAAGDYRATITFLLM